jgi:hypothetical protein
MGGVTFLAAWSLCTTVLLRLLLARLWRSGGAASRAYLIAGSSLLSIGVLQMAATPLVFGRFEEQALWFVTAGLAVALVGVLNLLNLRYRRVAPGLRPVCVAANLALTGVFVAVATHRGAEPPHDPVSVALMALALGAAYLSARRDRSTTAADGSCDAADSPGAGRADAGRSVPPEPPSGAARRLGGAISAKRAPAVAGGSGG